MPCHARDHDRVQEYMLKNSTVVVVRNRKWEKKSKTPGNWSVSEEWREKGNDSYRRVTDGLSPTVQVHRLQEALNCYERALSTATCNKEKSSALKNAAMASWMLAKAHSDDCATVATVICHFRQALSYFQDARNYGRGQTAAWHDSLTDTAVRCWFDVSAMMERWDAEVRMREMHRLVGYILDDVTKAREFLDMATRYFHWSLTALADKDFRQSLRLLKEVHFPLKEAQRHGLRDPRLPRDCQVLEEDVYIHTCVAESIQERARGEALLTQAICEEEVLNMDMIWEVVDAFRRAAQMTRDRDLEMEAMALSALGRVFDKILKLKDRAKACLMKVLELANSMVPRNFTGEDWYEFARSTVERYQQEKVRASEEKHQKEREEVLATIKEEVATLKTKHSDLSMQGFLQFVYTTHPPKNPEHKAPEESEVESLGLKKMYQRAVIHYHPDKVSVEDHGKKWKVLSEEITKLLTSNYESLK